VGGPGGGAISLISATGGLGGPGSIKGFDGPAFSIPADLISGLGLPGATSGTQDISAARVTGGEESDTVESSSTNKPIANLIRSGNKFIPGVPGSAATGSGSGKNEIGDAISSAIKDNPVSKTINKVVDKIKSDVKKATEKKAGGDKNDSGGTGE
jgi:hypothetical protein